VSCDYVNDPAVRSSTVSHLRDRRRQLQRSTPGTDKECGLRLDRLADLGLAMWPLWRGALKPWGRPDFPASGPSLSPHPLSPIEYAVITASYLGFHVTDGGPADSWGVPLPPARLSLLEISPSCFCSTNSSGIATNLNWRLARGPAFGLRTHLWAGAGACRSLALVMLVAGCQQLAPVVFAGLRDGRPGRFSASPKISTR